MTSYYRCRSNAKPPHVRAQMLQKVAQLHRVQNTTTLFAVPLVVMVTKRQRINIVEMLTG